MKRIISIGGGEIRNKTTLKIDEYIANLAKLHAGEKRANALFIGTASHDSMPYFNSFRKTYTSVFDIKAEVALMVYGEMDIGKIKGKIENADAIYIGGGDTMYMIAKWKELGVDKMLFDAYEKGTIIAGLSAGAICWFTDMYTDSEMMAGGDDYVLRKGLGILEGLMTPHYNERVIDFDQTFLTSNFEKAYAIENDCAVEFVDGVMTGAISAGGSAYILEKENGIIKKTKINEL
ncbi:MAG: Type 1 glutamine amidotransferase-like domain-containing protein [Clostridia bacterium]|nr:Type 1 glutamine amidotransferase-like domain-containing protein [Clostridia bacterium]